MKSMRLLFSTLTLIVSLVGCIIEEDDPSLDDIRDKFTGTWRFDEKEVKSTAAFYDVLITKDPANSSQILLRNFGNTGNFQQAYGIVTASKITVPTQTIASVIMTGAGTLSGSTRMLWTYSINDAADLKNYSATANKQ